MSADELRTRTLELVMTDPARTIMDASHGPDGTAATPAVCADDAPAAKPSTSRLRRFLVAAAAITLSVLVSFAILEFGLARFYYSNIDELRQDEFDTELGWRLKPGTYTVKAPEAFSTYTVSINRFGIRNAELTPSHPLGTRRIVVLGDSFTFGQGVDDETLFTTQLERRLNRGGGGKYEVINAGVPGYGTTQELMLMRRLANAGIVGDIYVVNLFTNDILDNLRLDYATRSENPVQPGFELGPDGTLAFTHKPKRELREGTNLVGPRRQPASKLLSVVKVRLQSLAQTKPGLVRLARRLGFDITIPRIPGIISAWYDDDVLGKGVPLTKALLAELKGAVKSRQGVLLVTLIPSPMQVHSDSYGEVLRASFPDDPMAKRFLEDPTRAQRIIRGMCAELGIPLLDMYGVLVAKKNQSFYIPIDGHFNQAGHSVFAERLEEFVVSHTAGD
jgi:lysophospholipase L1-like esterase